MLLDDDRIDSSYEASYQYASNKRTVEKKKAEINSKAIKKNIDNNIHPAPVRSRSVPKIKLSSTKDHDNSVKIVTKKSSKSTISIYVSDFKSWIQLRDEYVDQLSQLAGILSESDMDKVGDMKFRKILFPLLFSYRRITFRIVSSFYDFVHSPDLNHFTTKSKKELRLLYEYIGSMATCLDLFSSDQFEAWIGIDCFMNPLLTTKRLDDMPATRKKILKRNVCLEDFRHPNYFLSKSLLLSDEEENDCMKLNSFVWKIYLQKLESSNVRKQLLNISNISSIGPNSPKILRFSHSMLDSSYIPTNTSDLQMSVDPSRSDRRASCDSRNVPLDGISSFHEHTRLANRDNEEDVDNNSKNHGYHNNNNHHHHRDNNTTISSPREQEPSEQEQHVVKMYFTLLFWKKWNAVYQHALKIKLVESWRVLKVQRKIFNGFQFHYWQCSRFRHLQVQRNSKTLHRVFQAWITYKKWAQALNTFYQRRLGKIRRYYFHAWKDLPQNHRDNRLFRQHIREHYLQYSFRCLQFNKILNKYALKKRLQSQSELTFHDYHLRRQIFRKWARRCQVLFKIDSLGEIYDRQLLRQALEQWSKIVPPQSIHSSQQPHRQAWRRSVAWMRSMAKQLQKEWKDKIHEPYLSSYPKIQSETTYNYFS